MRFSRPSMENCRLRRPSWVRQRPESSSNTTQPSEHRTSAQAQQGSQLSKDLSPNSAIHLAVDAKGRGCLTYSCADSREEKKKEGEEPSTIERIRENRRSTAGRNNCHRAMKHVMSMVLLKREREREMIGDIDFGSGRKRVVWGERGIFFCFEKRNEEIGQRQLD